MKRSQIAIDYQSFASDAAWSPIIFAALLAARLLRTAIWLASLSVAIPKYFISLSLARWLAVEY